MGDATKNPAIEQALLAGFRGGWAAACRSLAEEIENQALGARLAAGGRRVTLEPRPLARMLLARATQPPSVETVAMAPGETIEQASARASAAVGAPPPASAEGPFPSAQEALPVLAALLSVIGGERGDVREKRAEWIALSAFGRFARYCAELDGLLPELDREAEALQAMVLSPQAEGNA